MAKDLSSIMNFRVKHERNSKNYLKIANPLLGSIRIDAQHLLEKLASSSGKLPSLLVLYAVGLGVTSSAEAILPLIDSSREIGSLVVRLIPEDFAESARKAFEGAETAVQVGNPPFISEAIGSEAVESVVTSLDAIMAKLRIVAKIFDRASKVWATLCVSGANHSL